MELPRVSLKEVSKWYGAVIGVNEVTLDIAPGITGLLGPNGAGKSTLMKLITGQLRPSIGEVRVLGKTPFQHVTARRKVGFLPEVDAFHEEMSARQFIHAMARLSGLSRGEAVRATGVALDRTGMAPRADKPLKGCSKGMRQRVKLAQAIVHDPLVIVLDEPLTGIDPPGRVELMALFRLLRDEGKTVLLSTHILHEVEEITDQIVLMAKGRVLASGTLGRIRGLMEDHPLTVRLSCSRRKEVASRLLGLEFVAAVALGDAETLRHPPLGMDGARARDDGDLIVKARRPKEFFRILPRLMGELGVEVERLQALDASVEAVFNYLVSGAGFDGTEEEP